MVFNFQVADQSDVVCRRYKRSRVGTALGGAKDCYQQRNATALVITAEVSRKREHLNTQLKLRSPIWHN